MTLYIFIEYYMETFSCVEDWKNSLCTKKNKYNWHLHEGIHKEFVQMYLYVTNAYLNVASLFRALNMGTWITFIW